MDLDDPDTLGGHDVLDDAEPAEPIVQWFDDSPWRVQFVPTAVAFTAGLVSGAALALVLFRALRD